VQRAFVGTKAERIRRRCTLPDLLGVSSFRERSEREDLVLKPLAGPKDQILRAHNPRAKDDTLN
jgi:hypothetical protein